MSPEDTKNYVSPLSNILIEGGFLQETCEEINLASPRMHKNGVSLVPIENTTNDKDSA